MTHEEEQADDITEGSDPAEQASASDVPDATDAPEPKASQAGAGAPRKEKVLHTRVPAVLEQELKRLASSLRVPVSNVVRTILEDAVETVDAVGRAAEGELRGVADRLKQQRHGRHERPSDAAARDEASGTASEPRRSDPSPPLAGVLGFQPLLLAREEQCLLCGRALERGEQAFLGIREDAGPKVLLGEECLPFAHRDA